MLNQGLKKPKEIFSKERFLAYSPAIRFKYIENLMREFVELNDGVTIGQIEKELAINYETVVRHLERLEATGDFYKATYGKTKVYFSNHKNLHAIGTREIDMGDKKFFLKILIQQNQPLLFIQEKAIEPTGNYSLRGSIIIPLNNTNLFFSEIRKFLQDYKEIEQR